MNAEDVRNYVERHLRRVLVEPVNITVGDSRYSIKSNFRSVEFLDSWVNYHSHAVFKKFLTGQQ